MARPSRQVALNIFTPIRHRGQHTTIPVRLRQSQILAYMPWLREASRWRAKSNRFDGLSRKDTIPDISTALDTPCNQLSLPTRLRKELKALEEYGGSTWKSWQINGLYRVKGTQSQRNECTTMLRKSRAKRSRGTVSLRGYRRLTLEARNSLYGCAKTVKGKTWDRWILAGRRSTARGYYSIISGKGERDRCGCWSNDL